MWQIVAAPAIDAQRLQNIISVRWYFMALHLLILVLAPFVSWQLPNFASLFPATAILLTLNLWGIARLKDHQQFEVKEVVFHLLIDSLCLFYLMVLTGGSHNPFALLFLIIVILAAQCLPLKATWGFSVFTCGLYILLFIMDAIGHGSEHDHHFNLHLLGMIASFVLLCFFITYYVASTTLALKEKEKELHDNDKLILIGAFAAQAAHQMGSPLSSLSVLVKQIEDQISPLYNELLQKEIQRCQTILRELADKTAFKKAHAGGRVELFHFVEQAISQWSSRNEFPVQIKKMPNSTGPEMILDKSFEYALYNLLDNAKEAGAKAIECVLECSASQIRISLIDDGKGLELPAKSYLELRPKARQSQGMGLGIYLTSMTVKALNGRLDLANNENRPGARAVITFQESYES